MVKRDGITVSRWNTLLPLIDIMCGAFRVAHLTIVSRNDHFFRIPFPPYRGAEFWKQSCSFEYTLSHYDMEEIREPFDGGTEVDNMNWHEKLRTGKTHDNSAKSLQARARRAAAGREMARQAQRRGGGKGSLVGFRVSGNNSTRSRSRGGQSGQGQGGGGRGGGRGDPGPGRPV